MNIRDEIVEQRKKRLWAQGHAQGLCLPSARELPLRPFGPEGEHPFVICEIKRRSPSKGAINEELDPVILAGRYIEGGAGFLSVLTEEAYFHGSLADLMAVKKARPEAAVLRKDFLLDEEDIDVSFRAGADAVLLIAAALEARSLRAMHERAASLGMAALVELHSPEDVEKVRDFKPPLTGVNSRSLETFTIDLLRPPLVRGLVDWPSRTVFESGVSGRAGACLAGSLGFDGILAGEALVRDPGAAAVLIQGFRDGRAAPFPFWNEIARRLGQRLASGRQTPLVKICGLTNTDDVLAADSLGADILGFVFAQSPRRTDSAFVSSLPETRALKAAVIVPSETNEKLFYEVAELVQRGKLDVIQMHGPADGPFYSRQALPSYGVIQPGSAQETADLVRNYAAAGSSPRFLLDACLPGAAGGTGKRLSAEILDAAKTSGPLWIAGGIRPENVRDIIKRWKPELIDLCGGVEASPGKKDIAKMKALFESVRSEDAGS
ncbi:MAG: bifunctional indole-3-glycerol phosphate synthase/phosphoribosylanthranilate isomerase [Spirochaetales bacterium]|jgi:indole-3-glycerol phosphate synthase/phosphoribosylanthranilate isomerase|nr:bifunctional indole-3-glycerol phosphate synthase/phosphoribosylanthranilate isomerase [Spirochaetales bacterium]